MSTWNGKIHLAQFLVHTTGHALLWPEAGRIRLARENERDHSAVKFAHRGSGHHDPGHAVGVLKVLEHRGPGFREPPCNRGTC